MHHLKIESFDRSLSLRTVQSLARVHSHETGALLTVPRQSHILRGKAPRTMSGPVDINRTDPLQRVSLNFLSISKTQRRHVPQSWWDDVSSMHSLQQSN
jgi:hypothetical protein